MEAHGSPGRQARPAAVGLLPDALAKPMTDKLAVDRLTALHTAIKAVPPRRHGVDQRRLRRRDRPDADDGDVRPRHPDADGAVPRPPLDRRHPRRCSPATTTPLGVETSPPTTCRWPRPPRRTRCSRRRPTGASRWSSRRERRPAARGSCWSPARRAASAAPRPHALGGEGDDARARRPGPPATGGCRARVSRAGAAGVHVVPCDVGRPTTWTPPWSPHCARHGRLDVVVHSAAGVVAYGALEEVPAEVFDGVLRTNLLGLGERRAPRRARAPAPGARGTRAAGVGARPHRGAWHAAVRREQVGRPAAGAAAAAGEPRPPGRARHPGRPRRGRHPGLPCRRHLPGPRRSAPAPGGDPRARCRPGRGGARPAPGEGERRSRQPADDRRLRGAAPGLRRPRGAAVRPARAGARGGRRRSRQRAAPRTATTGYGGRRAAGSGPWSAGWPRRCVPDGEPP